MNFNNSKIHETNTLIRICTFLPSQKALSCPFLSIPTTHSWPVLCFLVQIGFASSWTSYKWNYIIWTLLRFFLPYNISCTYLKLILFYWILVFYHTNMPYFFSHYLAGRPLSRFHFESYKANINVFSHKYFCEYVSSSLLDKETC